MRSEDIQRLKADFAPQPDPQVESESRLGLSIPNTHRLAKLIHNDLADGPPHGIAWWTPNGAGETAPRIFVSDYLYSCTNSIPGHLTSVHLHWLEFLDCVEREQTIFGQRTRVVAEGVRFRPRNPYEYLRGDLTRIHADGIVVALSSALDCLAGSIVGVTAAPLNIELADFGEVRTHLRNLLTSKRKKNKNRLQVQFAQSLEKIVKTGKGPDWIKWMSSYRKMIVHRARRTEVHMTTDDSVILGPDGLPARWRHDAHLPRHPLLSEVEAFLVAEPLGSICLAEKAKDTLGGLIKRTSELIEALAGVLEGIWTERRANPRLARQPLARQWKRPEHKPKEREISEFLGFASGLEPLDPAHITQGPNGRKRLLAAALDDGQNALWTNADMEGFVPGKKKNSSHP